MHIYIGALQLAAVIILSILLLCGLPLGELTMGGRYKVWPRKLRPVAASQLAVQIFALYILLAASGTLPCFISENVTKIICFVFTVFFLGNTVMNFFSPRGSWRLKVYCNNRQLAFGGDLRHETDSKRKHCGNIRIRE